MGVSEMKPVPQDDLPTSFQPVPQDDMPDETSARRPLIPEQKLSGAEKFALDFSNRFGWLKPELLPEEKTTRGLYNAMMVDPGVGAIQLGANLFGDGDAANRAVAEREADLEQQGISQGGRIAGSFLGPSNVVLGALAPFSKLGPAATTTDKLKTYGKNILWGGAGGAAAGTISPVALSGDQDYWSQKRKDVAMGGVFGGAATGVLPVAGKALGWAFDAVKGNFGTLQAQNAVRQILGPDTDRILALVANAHDDRTAVQAAYEAGVTNRQLAALGEFAAQSAPDLFGNKEAAQASARLTRILTNTPDEAASVASRQANMSKRMGEASQELSGQRAAFEASVRPEQVVTTPIRGMMGNIEGSTQRVIPAPEFSLKQVSMLKGNPIISAAIEDAKRMVASRSGLPDQFSAWPQHIVDDVLADPTRSVEGLQAIKFIIDNQLKNPSALGTAVSKFDTASLNAAKSAYMKAFEDASPKFQAANRGFASDSAPVNQSRVMQEAKKAMVKPGEQGALVETPAAFLAATEPGRSTLSSLLKRADQSPRFTQDLSDVLNPQQMAAINKNRAEFTRDLDLKLQASKGRSEMLNNLLEARWDARLPSFFNKFVTFANNILMKAEHGVSQTTRQTLAKGLQSGRSMNEMMSVLPTEEADKVMRAIVKEAPKLAPAFSAGGTTSMN